MFHSDFHLSLTFQSTVGYTVIALNQTVEKKIDHKTHVNTLDTLLPRLKNRIGVVFLKRLTINIDEDGEKGFGLVHFFSPCCLLHGWLIALLFSLDECQCIYR